MYFLYKMGIFNCDVSLPEGKMFERVLSKVRMLGRVFYEMPHFFLLCVAPRTSMVGGKSQDVL